MTEPSSSFSMLALFLLIGGAGAMAGSMGTSEYRDRQEAKARTERVTISKGQKLTAPGVQVMLGAVVVEKADRIASMPIYVEENTRKPGNGAVLSCLLLDKNKALLAGGGMAVPPTFTGTELQVRFARPFEGASATCKLVDAK